MRNRPDLEAGLFFTVMGGATALLSLRYSIGTATEMGPGYFPLILGILLACIGIFVTTRSFVGAQTVSMEPFQLKQLLAVTASVVLFAVVVLKFGLLMAIPVTVLVSLLAASNWRWKSAVVLVLVLTAICYGVFVVGLKIRLPVFGVF